MNIGFNYVFVSACKVNLSAQLFMCCYGQKVFIRGKWYVASDNDKHDKPFLTKAITIIDNFKKALDDIDNLMNLIFLKRYR